MATSSPARTRGYASMIQSWAAADGRSDSEMTGKAKLSTVLSMLEMSTGSIRTASANQLRMDARGGPAASVRWAGVGVVRRAMRSAFVSVRERIDVNYTVQSVQLSCLSTGRTMIFFPMPALAVSSMTRPATADTIEEMSDTAENPTIEPAAPASGSTRDRIVDAFAQLLGENGERAATLDAVAAAAGVSKGGLLYHFGSKEALIEGVLERLAALVERDVAAIRSSPSGPVAHLIRTSMATGSALDKALVATSRLAQASNSTARDALRRANDAWYGIVLESTGDPVLSRAIMLISDGLAYGSAFLPGSSTPETAELSASDIDDLVDLITEVTAQRAGH
jgi:AcrR family transcriptional regulator